MKGVKVADKVYNVGVRDPNLRNFHGYLTPNGSTYNSYLVVDEKITLIDTVHYKFSEQFIQQIKDIIDISKIDYLISNHAELDHSGAIPEIIKINPNIEIITCERGVKALSEHYNTTGWNFKVVKSFEEINIGSKTLRFMEIPMLHWPESMVTYAIEDAILFSNDAFGQHYCSEFTFAEEPGLEIAAREAKSYFANIIYGYAKKLNQLIAQLRQRKIDMIAPSHGLIWKGGESVKHIIDLYDELSSYTNKNTALIVYDSMWGTTKRIAEILEREFKNNGLKVVSHNLQETHISEIMTNMVDAKYVMLGTPNLNSSIMPMMAAFLNYMKGLAPHLKVGFAFGSYGWNPNHIKAVEEVMNALEWQVPVPPYLAKFKMLDEEMVKNAARDIIKS